MKAQSSYNNDLGHTPLLIKDLRTEEPPGLLAAVDRGEWNAGYQETPHVSIGVFTPPGKAPAYVAVRPKECAEGVFDSEFWFSTTGGDPPDLYTNSLTTAWKAFHK